METSFSSETISELKQAYQVLGMPLDSSALAIKRKYWYLAKKWHPDRWISDQSNIDIATSRMRELNIAYARIRHAPLRYYRETVRAEESVAHRHKSPYYETIPVSDRIETAVRFVCGFVFGVFATLSLVPLEGRWVAIMIILSLICGYCAVRFGDRFWHWVLEKTWLLW